MSVRLAVIGTGHLGKIHAKLAKQHPDAELIAVCDPIREAREAVAAEFQTSAVESHTELLGRIDAAIIATPTRFHYEVAADLLRRGVHTFIEKPITLNTSDADELIVIAERNRLALQVGHVERFNPAFQAALPHLGKPLFFDATRCGPYTCRSTDIGVVLDLMIHDLDLILSLQPQNVQRIDALGMPVFGPNEDLAQARITFADGAVANLQASRVSPTVQRTLTVYFETGYAAIDFQAKSVQVIRPTPKVVAGGVKVNELSSAERAHIKDNLFTEYLPLTSIAVDDCNAILEEQRNFLGAVQGREQVRVTGRDGRRAVDAAERILALLAEQQTHLPAGWRHDHGHKPTGPHWSRVPAGTPLRKAG